MVIKAKQRLRLGRELATRLVTDEGATGAFLAGSLVVGLGSRSSDLDIYLVGPGDREPRRQLSVSGTRIDIQALATERLVDLVERLLKHEGTPAPSDMHEGDLALATRLVTGEIVADMGALSELRARLVADPLLVRHLVVNHWVHVAQTAIDDLIGLRGCEDPQDLDSATTVGRSALLAAGKALAASEGDLHLGEKWVWHQLARSGPRGFPLASYRGLMRGDAREPDRQARLITFVQTCLAAVLTLGWADVRLDRWPSWTAGPGPLRRTTDFMPCASGERMVLRGPGARFFQVPAGLLLVWALCDGVTADELVDRVAEVRNLAKPWRGLDREGSHAALRELIDASLVVGANNAV